MSIQSFGKIEDNKNVDLIKRIKELENIGTKMDILQHIKHLIINNYNK